jgi:tryptophanyl-tRNA synthetase
MKPIVVSGIRPTGNLHLGNYFGAVKSFIQMQDDYNCYFFIADWHSLTTRPKPEDIVQSAHTILAEYLACGIDPEKATIYVQSDVKEVLELYLYLNMNAYLGEMERCTTFKEKARKQPENVNAGLLTYPTLMAADIFDGDHKKAISAAKAVEVFHNFSLVHDDIMDDAPLRRGNETVHEKWDINTGILSGDAMLILAYQLNKIINPLNLHI